MKKQFLRMLALGFVLGTPVAALADVECVQAELTTAGYKPGPVDGALGKKTYSAASKMAKDYKIELPKLSAENADGWCAELKSANAAALLNTEDKFREKIVGKKLVLDGNWAMSKADGTMDGNFNDKPVIGTWSWQDGFWCRDLTSPVTNTDCQVYRITPAGVVVTRKKGKGKSFVYQIEN